MVVDDEPDMRLAVRLILERCGHTVEEAASGEDACQRVQGAPPDLLLMDVRMPGQDGLETLEKIRESNKSLPVIIMTGYGNPETEREAFRRGANHYILKPFRNEDLIEAMSRVGLGKSEANPVARADPDPEKLTLVRSSVPQHFLPALQRFGNILRQAKAICLDRWYNPPILFERDPSLEERISLRLSVITDPIKVIYHGLLDKDYEFSLEEPMETQRQPPETPRKPLEIVYPQAVDSPPPAYPAAPAMVQPAAPEQDVERLHKDLSQQIQSVAKSLQAEIERLAEQVNRRQEPVQPPAEPAAAGSVQETPQEEFHRLLIDLRATWDQELSAIGHVLAQDHTLIDEWDKRLSELLKDLGVSEAA